MKTAFAIISGFLFFNIYLLSQVSDSLKYNSLGPEEFISYYRSASRPLLIDVREPFEAKKIIRGAVNIPSSGNIKAALDTANSKTPLFLYCTSGVRSKRVAILFYDKGFREIYSLKGGIKAWQKEGYPLVKARKRRK
jgi:rhodanese-related sulfurtransferase